MDIKSFWRRLTTPILVAEWHWSGDNLADLPKAAWRDFRRAIRAPIIKLLACNDLIIVGDVYGSSEGPAVVQVPSGHTAEIMGSICIHKGPAAVVPRGWQPLAVKRKSNDQV